MKRRTLLAALGATGTAGLAGCLDGVGGVFGDSHPPEPEGWPSYAHTLGNTRWTSDSGPTDTVTTKWETELDRAGSNSIVSDDTVYVVSDSLEAVDANTGEQRWRFQTDEEEGQDSSAPRVETGPTVADGIVYAGDNLIGTLYAVSASDGTEVWRREFGFPAGDPVVVDGVMYIAGGGDVHALHEAE